MIEELILLSYLIIALEHAQPQTKILLSIHFSFCNQYNYEIKENKSQINVEFDINKHTHCDN